MRKPRSSTSQMLSPQEARIGRGLRAAERCLAQGDDDRALTIYRQILTIDPAQSTATAEAARLLSQQRRFDTARLVLERSIKAGNQDAGAYLAVAELRLQYGPGGAEQFLAALPTLATVQAGHLLQAAELYRRKLGNLKQSLEMLHKAERLAPTDQAVLAALAAIYQDMGHGQRATLYWQRVTDQDARSTLGRAATDALLDVNPHTPRQVQTSVRFALREALGIFIIFFLLAVLDAGVSVTGISLAGWLGIGLSLLGGYLLVTATSSPGQRIFAPFLVEARPSARQPVDTRDRYLPNIVQSERLAVLPTDWRIVLGVAGAVLLVVAVVLILPHSMMATHDTLHALQQGQVPVYVDNWTAQLIDILGEAP